MAFQPIVDLNSMGVDLFEALVRWQGDEGHEVTPGEFIPLAEETGLIFPLGNWVLRKSVEAVSSLTTRAGRAVTVAINISGRQLSEPALVPLVSHLLKVHGAGASQVALEISERTVVGSWLAISKLQALRGLGCLVGLDDFGTGQSCLSYLASLPLDFIKIDRSFVSQLAADSRALRLVTTIVSFARDLGLMTIAEGVETPEQRDATTEAGCSHAQGYLFGRPAFLEDLGTVCPCA